MKDILIRLSGRQTKRKRRSTGTIIVRMHHFAWTDDGNTQKSPGRIWHNEHFAIAAIFA